MTHDERMPRWSNTLAWAAAGFVALAAFVLLVGAATEGDLTMPSRAWPGVAAALLAATALVAFSKRHVRFGLKSFASFLFVTALAIAAFLLAREWLIGTVSLEALGRSATVALAFGVMLVAFGLLGLALAALAHTRIGWLPPEQVELIVDQGRTLPYSCVVIAAMGLILGLLAFAVPAGPLAPGTALPAVAVLLAVVTGLSFAIWPRLDELSQTVSRETGNAAYYLILIVGGGWAILAHLGFLPGPAPLDWLSMLVAVMFAASAIAAGRRGMLRHPVAE